MRWSSRTEEGEEMSLGREKQIGKTGQFEAIPEAAPLLISFAHLAASNLMDLEV